ncbi:MAG: S8 family peptidase [Arenimonas sp.]|uniref:S8 family peptidase n=1 Tax=Arenimonas sp. TaxID=1872635 RepID=UPI003BFEE821
MIRLSLLASATMLALGVSSAADAGGRPDLVKQGLAQGKQYAAGQLIIQYRSFATAADKARVGKALGNGVTADVLARKGSKQGVYGDLELVRFNFPAGTQMSAKIDAIINDPAVDFAEPNWLVSHTVGTNDPYYTNGSLWGMYGANTTPANQFGSGAGAAAGNNCSGVWVGVIDEGYMNTHPDLVANVGTNPGETAGNARDDDGNGLIDDVYGWDFDGNNNTVFDGAGDDHGTHVSGTIAGVGNNGVGVAGVCHSGVKILNAKFLGGRGGTTANAIKAVDYFTDLKTRHGINLVATNNSWGGGGFSQALQDAIGRADSAGILFIAAAGNSGANNDATPSYPSGYPNANIIAVAALASNGTLASYSQYGATTVDICAPGSGVWSTVPQSSKGKVVAGYASYNGTSMATPHVTGAAALYAARHPGSSAAQIKAAILGSATPTTACAGKVSTGGRLNVSGF